MLLTKNKIAYWVKRHRVLVIVVVLSIIINYPWFYFGGPIEGYVVDKQTGQPIEGVVAIFSLSVTGPRNIFHGHQSFTIELAEAVTDETGRYEFSWWVSKNDRLRPFFRRVQEFGFTKWDTNLSVFTT